MAILHTLDAFYPYAEFMRRMRLHNVYVIAFFSYKKFFRKKKNIYIYCKRIFILNEYLNVWYD